MDRKVLALIGVVLVVGMTTSGARVAEAFAPPVLVAPVLAPLVTAPAAVAATSGAVTIAGTAAAGVACAVGCTIALAGAAAAALGYMGWHAWSTREWWWPEGEPDTAPAGGDLAADSTVWVSHHQTTMSRPFGTEYWPGAQVKATQQVPGPVYAEIWLSDGTAAKTAMLAQYGMATGEIKGFSNPCTPSTVSCTVTKYRVYNNSGTLMTANPSPGTMEPRRVKSVATFMNDAGQTRTETKHSPWYTDGTDPLPMLPGHAGSELERIVDLEVTRESSNPSIIPNKTMIDWAVPQEHLNPQHQYADCLKGAPCQLVLMKILTDGRRIVCNVEDSPCVGWAESVNRDLEYECHWGPHVMALEQCAALAQPYRAPVGSPTTVITAPNPTLPSTNPVPQPETDGWHSAITNWFVPTKLPSMTESLRETASTKPPFSLAPAVAGTVTGVTAGWTNTGCGLLPHFMPAILTEGPATVEDGRFLCAPPDSSAWQALYAFVGLAIVVGTGWRLFAMAGAAMGGRGTGDPETDTD